MKKTKLQRLKELGLVGAIKDSEVTSQNYKEHLMNDLMNLSPNELKNMDKQTLHEAYKKILANLLMQFYIDCTFSEINLKTMDGLSEFITMGGLSEFIKIWIDKHIKPPPPEWNPGDCGK